MTAYNITDQMGSQTFDLQNASYVLKLDFSLNDTTELKKYLQQTQSIEVKANNLIYLSRSEVGSISCKQWSFSIIFDFSSLVAVHTDLQKSFQECNGNQYDRDVDEGPNNTILFTEQFIFNLISFVTNFAMTMMIVNVIIDVFKYRSLKEEKKAKYRWLLRNKKNFEGEVKFRKIKLLLKFRGYCYSLGRRRADYRSNLDLFGLNFIFWDNFSS